MDRLLLLDAVRQLEILGSGGGSFARSQGVSQFNALLRVAKDHHPDRGDIQSLQSFQQLDFAARRQYGHGERGRGHGYSANR